jgi:HPt (histidine-containing phosphotransfer) domain-containing protein
MSDGGKLPPTPIVSRRELLKRVDGDMELLQDLVDLFLEELPQRLEALRAALDQDDLESLHEKAHAIKGSVSNFAAAAAFEAASQVNDLARSGTRNGLKQAIDVLEQEMSRLQPALREIVESS